jgi:hypothetical protein
VSGHCHYGSLSRLTYLTMFRLRVPLRTRRCIRFHMDKHQHILISLLVSSETGLPRCRFRPISIERWKIPAGVYVTMKTQKFEILNIRHQLLKECESSGVDTKWGCFIFPSSVFVLPFHSILYICFNKLCLFRSHRRLL